MVAFVPADGLHYHTTAHYGAMLDELLALLVDWARAVPGRVPLFRELSAQHFPGGAWKPGAHKPKPGTPCTCEPLQSREAASGLERVVANQNVEFNALAARKARARGVGIVPFFNLTAPRHNMHRRHFCSYSNQKNVGRCCDCTHFCYTPIFWDIFFSGLREAIVTHPSYDGAGGRDAFGGGPGAARSGNRRIPYRREHV